MSEDGNDLQGLVDKIRSAMLTTDDLRSRPMSVQRVDADGTVWFLVDARADWIGDLPGPVNVAWVASDRWISGTGQARLVRDQGTLDDLGDPVSDSFFDEGAERAAIRVDLDRADTWTSPNRLSRAVRIAVGAVTGDQGDAGDRDVLRP